MLNIMTLQIINNNYTEISIIMYVEHPDNDNLMSKNVSLLDIPKVLEDTISNEFFINTNL